MPGQDDINFNITNVAIIGKSQPPKPTPVSVGEIQLGNHNWRFTRVQGILRDVQLAENSSSWRTMRLCAPDSSIYISGPASELNPERLEHFIGREVTVDGFPVLSGEDAGHIYTGPHFHVANDRAFRPVSDRDSDPFLAPTAETLHGKNPEFIARCGRRRIIGRVICTWNGNKSLIQTEKLGIVMLVFNPGSLPASGATIEASGLPTTDLYRLTLVHALWRPTNETISAPDATAEPTRDSPVREILKKDPSGNLSVKIGYDGLRTCLSGTVRKLPGEFENPRILLEDQDTFFSIDVGNAPSVLASLSKGCRVEATGICLLEKEFWHPGLVVPRITGLTLILSGPEDLRIVSRPPWWTPTRLWIAMGVLLSILVAFAIWVRILQRLVERKGRELYRSQIEQATAELKTTERTRLAVELHDSISQNLTGVSLQIDAARRLMDRSRDETVQHLCLASKTLRSCREELRNCIWDLRNQTVDERDLNEAIRRTIQRQVGDAELSIRFNIPRQRITDTTVYMLMRVIRELATNAVRHGHATVIRIAGALDGGNLSFSVTDNGCGFDPNARPGVADGHFGLQGVAERIKDFGGTMEIESAAGKGTRVCIRLRS